MTIDHFFRGAFSIDLVLLTFFDDELQVFIQVKDDIPVKGDLGLPGRLILPNENSDEAIHEMIIEITNQEDLYRKQLQTFSAIDRHPLGRIVTFSYYALLPEDKRKFVNMDNAKWCKLSELPELCLDHKEILKSAINRFRKGLTRHPLVFQLLAKEFTIAEIKCIYESAFSIQIDHSNFARVIKKSKLLEASNKTRKSLLNKGRPSQLYKFKPTKKIAFKEKIHFNFE